MSDSKLFMRHLGILATTYCNLNCRECADMVPKKPYSHYQPDLIQSDLERVLSVVDRIDEVLVIGGEILLYPHLESLLSYLGGIEKIKKIIITTNGTMIPDESLLKTLKENSVIVRVSGYP